MTSEKLDSLLASGKNWWTALLRTLSKWPHWLENAKTLELNCKSFEEHLCKASRPVQGHQTYKGLLKPGKLVKWRNFCIQSKRDYLVFWAAKGREDPSLGKFLFLGTPNITTFPRVLELNVPEKCHSTFCDPTTRIPNSSSVLLVTKICVQLILGTKRAIIDPLVSKQPENKLWAWIKKILKIWI